MEDIAITFFSLLLVFFLLVIIVLVKTKQAELTLSFKIFLFFFFGVPIFFMVRTKWGSGKLEKQHEEYFKNFNISFVGRVDGMFKYEWFPEYQPGGGPKFNLYRLKLLKSTTKYYDPSDTSYFYCTIKDSIAILIEETIHDNILGDNLLYFNGKVDTMYHYKIKRKKRIKKGKTIWLNEYDTILYDKWRPEHIFNQPHRHYIYEEYKKVKRLK